MICNGIDTDLVRHLAGQLSAHPDAALVRVRTSQRWEGGYAVAMTGSELLVSEESIPRAHGVRSDRPVVFGGGDRGPVPGELLLAALAACVGSQFLEQAALREVEVEHLEVGCEGRVDLRGSYGASGTRPGLQGVGICLAVCSAADDRTVEELVDRAVRTSPVADSLTAPVTVEPSVQRVGAP